MTKSTCTKPQLGEPVGGDDVSEKRRRSRGSEGAIPQ